MDWRKILLCVIIICLVLLVFYGKTRGSETVIPITIETLAEPARLKTFEDTVEDAHSIVRGQVTEVICEERIPSYKLEEYKDPEDVPLNEKQVYTVYTIWYRKSIKAMQNPVMS